MPRQRRLILPDIALHITQRGNNRDACFRVEGDYLIYLLHLRELASQLGCRVHAYCLMTNHVHLLLTPSFAEACISLMRNLGQRYVQFFNRRHGRTGTLWEGRFHSCIAESARYVLACYRYIESNPVRAGMVDHPAAYHWSSYAANAGLRGDPLVSPHCEYIALAAEKSERQTAYSDLFEDCLQPSLLGEIREATNGGYPLGSATFKADVAALTGCKIAPGLPGRPARSEGEARKSGSDPDFGF